MFNSVLELFNNIKVLFLTLITLLLVPIAVILIMYLTSKTSIQSFSPAILLAPSRIINLVFMILSYALLCIAVFNLWKKQKQHLLKKIENELQEKQRKIIIETAQKMTASIAQNITPYNNEIKAWIEKRKHKGQVPATIEKANIKISEALEVLSKTSFLLPYIEKETEDYTKKIEKELTIKK